MMLHSWVRGILHNAPVRTLPLLLMDSNAHVGTTRVDADISEPTGPFRPQMTTWAGVQLSALLRDNRLALANTWIPGAAGPTWTDGIHYSRIDYIALPK
eukprot:8860836-Heterocapsa_arctica.AAC.1